MKKNILLLLILICICLSNCTKKDRKSILKQTSTISDDIKSLSNSAVETIITTKETIKNKIIKATKEHNKTAPTAPEIEENTADKNSKDQKFLGFTYFKKFLQECETGKTITQQELIENHNIPKEGIKLIKSITKTGEDELEIKWKSTWFIEKISDAKFKDAKIKVRFGSNKTFVSGGAIGIKYNKKIYNELIIIGNAAYIPTVKGYHWKIGK